MSNPAYPFLSPFYSYYFRFYNIPYVELRAKLTGSVRFWLSLLINVIAGPDVIGACLHAVVLAFAEALAQAGVTARRRGNLNQFGLLCFSLGESKRG